MTTIKLGFRPSKEDRSWGTVCFLLTHQRRVRTVNTDYHLLAENWNEERRTFVPLGNEQQQDELRLLAAKVSWEVKRISDIIVRRESMRIEYGIDELMDEIRSLPPVQTFFSFVRQQIDNLNQRRRAGTATAYGNMLRSFMLYAHAACRLPKGCAGNAHSRQSSLPQRLHRLCPHGQTGSHGRTDEADSQPQPAH